MHWRPQALAWACENDRCLHVLDPADRRAVEAYARSRLADHLAARQHRLASYVEAPRGAEVEVVSLVRRSWLDDLLWRLTAYIATSSYERRAARRARLPVARVIRR